MGSLPPAKAGVGSAVNDTARELGGTLGVAIVGSVFSSIYASRLGDALAGTPVPADAIAIAKESVGAAEVVAQQAGAPAGPQAQALRQRRRQRRLRRRLARRLVGVASASSWSGRSSPGASCPATRATTPSLDDVDDVDASRRRRRLIAGLTTSACGDTDAPPVRIDQRDRDCARLVGSVRRRRGRRRPHRPRLPARRGTGHGRVPGHLAAPAAAARGRGRRRQDRGRQGARRVDRRRADPPAVLRGHRRRPGRLRLGLRPPAAPPAGRRGQRRVGRAVDRRPRGRAVPGALPRQAGAAAGDRAPRGSAAGAARRRDRPRRRRVRGVPARRSSRTGRSPCPSSACSAPSTRRSSC